MSCPRVSRPVAVRVVRARARVWPYGRLDGSPRRFRLRRDLLVDSPLWLRAVLRELGRSPSGAWRSA